LVSEDFCHRHLPMEIWEKIIENINSVKDLKHISLTCKLFSVLSRGYLWQISKSNACGDEIYERKDFPMQHLVMFECNDAHLLPVSHISTLNSLDLSCNDDVTDKGLLHLQSLPQLHTFVFKYHILSDSAMQAISKISSLRVLDLSSTRFTTTGLSHLTQLSMLEYLNIHSCALSNSSMPVIGQLETLEELDISYNTCGLSSMDNSSFEYLPRLKELNIDSCKINDRDMTAISRLHCLQKLNMSYNADVTDIGFFEIKDLPNLKELNVSCCSLNDACLATISVLYELQKLEMAANRGLTPLAYSQFKHLPKLTELVVWNCDLNDEHLMALRKVSNLQVLDITNNEEVTDTGILYLNELPKLRTLVIYACSRITDSAIYLMAERVNIKTDCSWNEDLDVNSERC